MNRQVATELLVLRTRKGKTIKEVSEQVGIDPTTLSRIENSKNSISVEMIEKLLNYYEEDISIFFTNVCVNMHKD